VATAELLLALQANPMGAQAGVLLLAPGLYKQLSFVSSPILFSIKD
jgi:hypothetical protein